jgi:hypothetical protein
MVFSASWRIVYLNAPIALHATRYAKGGAESCEYCDEKLNDVLPNFFLDSHNSLIFNG